MRNIVRCFFFILVLGFICSELLAEPIIPDFLMEKEDKRERKKFDIRLNTDLKTAASWFDAGNKEQLEDSVLFVVDTLLGDEHIVDSIWLGYTTEFSSQKYGISMRYSPTPLFYVSANVPIERTRVVEKFKYDTDVLSRYEKNNKTQTKVPGISISAGYKIDLNMEHFS